MKSLLACLLLSAVCAVAANLTAPILVSTNQKCFSLVLTQTFNPPPVPPSCDSVNDGSLKAYWKLDEASGNAIDSKGANTLTDVDGPTAETGKISGARGFSSAIGSRFSIADNTDLSPGNADFTFSAWVFPSGAGDSPGIIGKGDTAGQREYGLYLDNLSGRYIFYVSADGTALVTVTANSFGAPSLTGFDHVVCWHDATANTINIQVNNGTVDSVSHTTGVFDGTEDFFLGANIGTGNWNGIIDEAAFWSRILDATELTNLQNSGNACRPAGL